MPNFTEEDLEHCRQKWASCVCEGPCTGQRRTIKVATLTVLVGSLYSQSCVCMCVCVYVCVHFISGVCVCVIVLDRSEAKIVQKQEILLQH